MTDQQNNSYPSNAPSSKRDLRREERRAARQGRGTWVGGAMLIALGVILLLENMNMIDFNNWWALFILLPAVGAFTNAWQNYQEDGQLSQRVRASLLGGFILVMVSMTFLLNWNWAYVGPLLLIATGVGFLLNSMVPDHKDNS